MLNEMAKEFHEISRQKGFWDKERDPFQVLFLIISEATEAGEELRNGEKADELYFDGEKPMGVPSELADIIIRTLDAAAAWGIDIDAAVHAKYEYNKKRPYLHGRTC